MTPNLPQNKDEIYATLHRFIYKYAENNLQDDIATRKTLQNTERRFLSSLESLHPKIYADYTENKYDLVQAQTEILKQAKRRNGQF